MINTKKPFRFYDDRGKSKEYIYPKKIISQTIYQCVCSIESEEGLVEYILFDKETGEVLNTNYDCYYAENYKK